MSKQTSTRFSHTHHRTLHRVTGLYTLSSPFWLPTPFIPLPSWLSLLVLSPSLSLSSHSSQ